MTLRFKKYGLLAHDVDYEHSYTVDGEWWTERQLWAPVWWWPMNWLLIATLWYVALLVVGAEGEAE